MSSENRIQYHRLSNDLVQAIGDYLISRPYREVAVLISGLQNEVQSSVRANGIGTKVGGEPDVSTELQQ